MLKQLSLCNFVTRGAQMEELQVHLHVAHEADCEKPGETFTAD